MIEESNATAATVGRAPRSSRRWFGYVPLFLSVAGLVLAITGLVMPAYTDPVAAERIMRGTECEAGVPNTDENQRCDTQQWFRSMNALRTNKWRFVDVGDGLLASGLTTGIFLCVSRRRSWQQLLTPKHSLWIVVLAATCWWIQIPAYVLYFLTELSRDSYPLWADSIAIPIFAIRNFVRILFLPYVAIWLFLVVGSRLPAKVFSSLPGRPVVNVFWTCAAALLFVPNAFVLIVAILDGPIVMVPLLWLVLWLVLCARAAALTRHRGRAAHIE